MAQNLVCLCQIFRESCDRQPESDQLFPTIKKLKKVVGDTSAFSNIMDRASSSSLFRYVRVHFATFKSHARTSLREVVVDPIAGDTLGEKQSKNQVESGLKT